MQKNIKVSIVDYGVGNLFSITNAVKLFEKNTQIVEDPNQISDSDCIILPGVGSFKGGMAGLKLRNLVEPITEFAKKGKPILAICLGAQLLMSRGYEFGLCKGMGIISGTVVKFPKFKGSVKVPHIGWNNIYPNKNEWKGSILKSIKPASDFYFVHSYIIEPKNKIHILASTKYGNVEFTSVIKKDNIYGCQFHPEKSGTVGLTLLKKFIEFAKKLS